MNISLDRLRLSGSLNIPPSKSMMQRACAGALLHKGTTYIHHPGSSDDDKVALNIVSALGAQVVPTQNGLAISSGGKVLPGADVLHCGESGLSARLFLPIASFATRALRIEAGGSLVSRPMHFFDTVLPALGVSVQSAGGYFPYTVCGPLHPENITVDGSLSSQFISGLLFAYTAAANREVSMRMNKLVSKPYLDMSLQVLALFGRKVINRDYEELLIDPAFFTEKEIVDITIEGDWSSAAFWIAAGALQGPVRIQGLRQKSTQADRAIVDILRRAGADMEWSGHDLCVVKHSLKSFEADLTDCPDLFPVLSVLLPVVPDTVH